MSSEVAHFCQKYMAAELAKLQSGPEASVSDSLVKVFHKMDEMLREECYTQVFPELVSGNCCVLTTCGTYPSLSGHQSIWSSYGALNFYVYKDPCALISGSWLYELLN